MSRRFDIKTKLMGKGLLISTIQVAADEPKERREWHVNALGWAYETLVFHRSTDGREWDRQNYQSASEARAGHRKMVAKWKAKTRKQIRDELDKVENP